MERSAARVGVAYGLAAYGWWGLVPIYFKAVSRVPALEVLAHRIIWSIVLLAILMRLFGRWATAWAVLRDRGTLLTLCGSTTLLACNWFTFIWAVANNQVREASLGYFINPLVSVMLGFIFLRERLRRWQMVSVALATAAVLLLGCSYGKPPWVALILAGSFGLYGLLRKTARAESMVGLTVEVIILGPLALTYLGYLLATGKAAFGSLSVGMDLLLALGGVITAVPLLWFASAARRLRLATMGFLQYIAPSLQLTLAVAAYGEAFTRAHALTFGLIWTALAIYSVDTYRASRGR